MPFPTCTDCHDTGTPQQLADIYGGLNHCSGCGKYRGYIIEPNDAAGSHSAHQFDILDGKTGELVDTARTRVAAEDIIDDWLDYAP